MLSQQTIKFDAADIYLARLEEIKSLDDESRQQELRKLIEQEPDFPDAYLELARLCAKTNTWEAVDWYTQLIHLCPYHVEALKERDKEMGFLISWLYYLNIWLSESSEPSANKAEKDRNDFRLMYHAQLQRGLQNINDESVLALKSLKVAHTSDFTDISLTNGAADDAYLGYMAVKQRNDKLASFLFRKAILKFKHDFYTLSNQGDLDFCDQSNDLDALLKEFDGLIKKYNFAKLYYMRSQIHFKKKQIHKGKPDFEKFLVLANKAALSVLDHDKDIYLDLMNGLHDGSDSINHLTLTKIERLEIEEKTNAFLKLEDKVAKKDAVKELAYYNKLISQKPGVGVLYAIRGSMYECMGNYQSSILDYSMALWLQDASCTARIYMLRGMALLHTGEFRRAYHDFIEMACLDKNQEYFNKIYNEMLKVGRKFFQDKDYKSAEEVFRIGIDVKPTAEMKFELASLLFKQEKYSEVSELLDNIALDVLDLKTRNKVIGLQDKNQKKLPALALVAVQEAPVVSEETPAPLKPKKDRKKKTKSQVQEKPFKPAAVKRGAQVNTNILRLINEAESAVVEEEVELKQDVPAEEKPEATRKKKTRRVRTTGARHTAKPADNNDADDTYLNNFQTIFCRPKQPPVELKVNFGEIEKEIFEKIAAYNKKNNTSYQTRLVGGYVMDKILELYQGRPMKVEDLDYATELPVAVIKEIFPTARPYPYIGMENVLSFKYRGVNIDIKHSDKISLDYLDRDFFAAFIKEDGSIIDVNGHDIKNLLAGRLMNNISRDRIFVEDPLRMLRMIRHDGKRNLRPHKKLLTQLEKDKYFLTISDAVPVSKLNHWIEKLFTGDSASKCYARLRQFNLLENLFPGVALALDKDHAFILAQMKICDKIGFQPLEVIYSNFIISAVMHDIDHRMPEKVIKRLFNGYCSNTALFSPFYQIYQEQPDYFEEALKRWRDFHQEKQIENDLTEVGIENSRGIRL